MRRGISQLLKKQKSPPNWKINNGRTNSDHNNTLQVFKDTHRHKFNQSMSWE